MSLLCCAAIAGCATSPGSSTDRLLVNTCVDANAKRSACACRNELKTITIRDFTTGTLRHFTTPGVRLEGRCMDSDVAAALLCSDASVTTGYAAEWGELTTHPRSFLSTDALYRPLLRIECLNNAGVRDGPTMTWDLWTGRPQRSGQYVNAKAEGVWYWTFPTGQVTYVEHYRAGEKHGPSYDYSWHGDLIRVDCYRDGDSVATDESGSQAPCSDNDGPMSSVDVERTRNAVSLVNTAVAEDLRRNPASFSDEGPGALPTVLADGTPRFVTLNAQIPDRAGTRVLMRGTYIDLDTQTTHTYESVMAGRAGIRLADGTVVELLSADEPAALRSRYERRQFLGEHVVAEGLLHEACPSRAETTPQAPCISPLLVVLEPVIHDMVYGD